MSVLASIPQLPHELLQATLIRRLQLVPGEHGPQKVSCPNVRQLSE
jgi:hypothetical protein